MARIIGAVACSHTPTIGFAFDKSKQQDPVWAPIFEAFAPAQRWLEEQRPDVLFFICNDHVAARQRNQALERCDRASQNPAPMNFSLR